MLANNIDLDKTIVMETQTTFSGVYRDYSEEHFGKHLGEYEIVRMILVDGHGSVLMNQCFKPEIATEWPDAYGIAPEDVKNAPRFCDVKSEIEELLEEAETIITRTRLVEKTLVDTEKINVKDYYKKNLVRLDRYSLPVDTIEGIRMIAKKNAFSPSVVEKDGVERCRMMLYLFYNICQKKGILLF